MRGCCAQGNAAWEAALVNSMEEGDTGLVLSTGTFAKSWGEIAESVGVLVETIDFGMSATVSSSVSRPTRYAHRPATDAPS